MPNNGDGDVEAGVGVFLEGAGREDGETAVIDGSAIEFFGDGAGRGLGGVHVVDAESHGGDDDSGNCKEGNQILHGFILAGPSRCAWPDAGDLRERIMVLMPLRLNAIAARRDL